MGLRLDPSPDAAAKGARPIAHLKAKKGSESPYYRGLHKLPIPILLAGVPYYNYSTMGCKTPS